MKDYKKLFKRLDINSEDSVKFLRRQKYSKFYRNILNILIAVPWGLLLYAFLTEDSNKDLGTSFGIVGLFTIFIYGPLILLYFLLRNHYEGKLEQVYFDEFLSKKLKIFYFVEELKDYTYDVIKDITKSANSQYNNSQALILACHDAYELGAEGVLVTSNQQSSVVTGETKRGKGNVKTTLVGTVSIRALKNLKAKPQNSDSKDNKDLDYWYGMYEKGAITKEQYEKKRDELI